MSKPNKFGQPLPKKSKASFKASTPQISLKINTNSLTPTLKFLNQPLTLRSGAITRETQSYASSPHHRAEELKSFRPSPSPKERLEIDDLLKKSLRKFKSQKHELEKIKETARSWKESRKRKMEEYNVQTRNENKLKFKYEAFRPKTAWGSPEIKDSIPDHRHTRQRHSGCSSTERRAGIGLEFYNLKSPRNCTPKILQETPSTKPKPVEEKKDLEEFIKKKRKERQKIIKLEKDKQEEFEFKRMSQLIQIDRIAKKALKKKSKKIKIKNKKKGKKKHKHVYKPRIHESFQSIEILPKHSVCYSEDEEVLKIMDVRKFTPSEPDAREGRECLIFGNFSNQFSNENANATEIANKIVGKITKSEDHSIIVSASQPIIELKSISNDSGSDISEKKQNLKKKLEELKNRVEVVKDAADDDINIEKNANLDIGVHKLVTWINSKYVAAFFTIIKLYQKSIQFVETPQLSGFRDKDKGSNYQEIEEKKEELEEALSKLARGVSREGSEDMEKIWDRIMLTSKNTDFLVSPEPIPTLSPFGEKENYEIKTNTNVPFVPLEDERQSSKKSSLPSNKHSSDLSSSMMDQLKKVQFPSAEYMSFGNVGEVTHEDLIDSPSLLSLNSHNSDEPNKSEGLYFEQNSPLEIILPDPEPRKPTIADPKRPSPILIDDGSSSISMSEYAAAIKESSSIATPEAEEIEEFSSINFDLNFKRPEVHVHETSLNPFSISEETLVLDEDEIIDKTYNCLSQWYLSDLIYFIVTEDYKRLHYQLLGNAKVIFHEVCVRTGVTGVMSFVEKIWNMVNSDIDEFVDSIKNQKIHLDRLAMVQNMLDGDVGGILKPEVLANAETPSDMSISLSLAEIPSEPVKVHNRMIFDCVNCCLNQIQFSVNPPPWKTGVVPNNDLQVELILQQINKEIRKNCLISAGRIPNIAMIGQDGNLDEDLLQKIRESSLANLIIEDMNNGEKDWVDYDLEETQIVLEIADGVVGMIIQEIFEIVN